MQFLYINLLCLHIKWEQMAANRKFHPCYKRVFKIFLFDYLSDSIKKIEMHP